MAGHLLDAWGDPCPTCRAADAAFEAQLRNPPAEMVIRPRDGGPPQFYRIPKHLQRRVRR